MLVRRWVAFAVCSLALSLSIACRGPDAPKPKEAPTVMAEQGAEEIASGIVGARIHALFYMDRMRYSSLARLPEVYYFVRPLFHAAEIDPRRDVERLFIAVTAAHSHDMVLVLQHTLSRARVEALFDKLARKAGRSRRADLPYPATDAYLDEHDRFVAEPEPGFLVVLPPGQEDKARLFVGTRGFPDPKADECGEFVAMEPSSSLADSLAPNMPRDLAVAYATLAITSSGGARILFDAVAPTSDKARDDARMLTKATDDATSVELLSYRLHVLTPPRFEASGRNVKTRFFLTKEELDWSVAKLLTEF